MKFQQKPDRKSNDLKKEAVLGKQTRKILFAAMLSMCAYGVTYYFYQGSAIQANIQENLKPVAFANNVEEDVQRRPASRLIWQMLNTGEPLYPGEAIKTSNRATVRIQFSGSERYIDLDPDSLIVISQNNNEISLDLMDGSLFVAGGSGSDNTALTLNSAKGKVDLSKATASLSKSGSGQLDLQVLKGSAKSEDGRDLSSTSSHVKLHSPKVDSPTAINPENVEPIKFSWTGFPPDTQVSLWLGPSRKDLKSLAQTIDPKQTQLDKKIPVGKHFFKLIAIDKKTGQAIAESQTYRLEVVAKYPPGVIAPAGDSFLVMDKQTNPVTFKWEKPNNARNVYFELSKDADFKNKIATKNFSEEESYVHSLAGGDYYYRLSSTYDGIEKPITTKAIKFTISSKPKTNISINWSEKDSKPQYFVEKAVANFGWDSPQKSEVKKWRLHVWPTSEGREIASDTEKTVETDKKESKIELTGGGKYNAVVEALNEHGATLGKSDVRTIDLLPKPILKAPLLYPETGELKADNKGNLELKWTKYEDAKEYTLILMDKDGKELKRGRFAQSSTSLVNLMPGQYKVKVIAKDIHGRESEDGDARSVVVPDSSGLKAPKLKKVKVN